MRASRFNSLVLVLRRGCGLANFTFGNIPRYYYLLATPKIT